MSEETGHKTTRQERKHYSFFTNRECEYFPCHKGADPEDFNCLFCYCPLYALGKSCGGDFRYLESGIKDCSSCMFPHHADNYKAVTSRYREVMETVRMLDSLRDED